MDYLKRGTVGCGKVVEVRSFWVFGGSQNSCVDSSVDRLPPVLHLLDTVSMQANMSLQEDNLLKI
jgi:hypothetical protein